MGFQKDKTSSKASENTGSDYLANLKLTSEINNTVLLKKGELVICNPAEVDIRELSELWANLATVQQIYAPERYNFKAEEKNWQIFVSNKIKKQSNLLLIAKKNNNPEVKGFLYLQTITIPSSNLVLKAVIEDIYTKPQYRRQGVAKEMLDVALEWAENHNIKQIDFITLTRSKDLIPFYLRYIKNSKHDIRLELVTI